jgi:hypothetical protein
VHPADHLFFDVRQPERKRERVDDGSVGLADAVRVGGADHAYAYAHRGPDEQPERLIKPEPDRQPDRQRHGHRQPERHR